MTLLARLDKFPPFLCRIVARSKARGGVQHLLSLDDISQRSGLSKSRVADLAYRRTWLGIKMDTASRFAEACGVDFARLRAHRAWLKRRKVALKGKRREYVERILTHATQPIQS